MNYKKCLSKKELLTQAVRAWDNTDKYYDAILLVPAGTKHESGFMHIAIIGVTYTDNDKTYEICGYPDDISTFFEPVRFGKNNEYSFASVRMDCYYPSGVLQYHGNGKFWVSSGLCSMDIKFIPNK